MPSASGLDLRNGNWTMRWNGEDSIGPEPDRTAGSVRRTPRFLSLVPGSPRRLWYQRRFPQGGGAVGSSPHAFPRPEVSGARRSKPRTVHGEAWMDHEFSSSQLGAGQVGWDRAGIQLNDGREIMAYRMRREDGSLIHFRRWRGWMRRGRPHLGPDQFQWTPDGLAMKSGHGRGISRPIRLTAFDPQSGTPRALTLEPVAAAQELTGGLGGIAGTGRAPAGYWTLQDVTWAGLLGDDRLRRFPCRGGFDLDPNRGWADLGTLRADSRTLGSRFRPKSPSCGPQPPVEVRSVPSARNCWRRRATGSAPVRPWRMARMPFTSGSTGSMRMRAHNHRGRPAPVDGSSAPARRAGATLPSTLVFADELAAASENLRSIIASGVDAAIARDKWNLPADPPPVPGFSDSREHPDDGYQRGRV